MGANWDGGRFVAWNVAALQCACMCASSVARCEAVDYSVNGRACYMHRRIVGRRPVPCCLRYEYSCGRTLSLHIQLDIHTHARLTALYPGLPGWAGTRIAKSIWTLLKQETVSGSGISWAIRKSVPCYREITTPAPDHSVFYRPDALPAAKPTVSKRQERHPACKKLSGGVLARLSVSMQR